MPFTFAHPAVVFPFKYLPKKWYSWTGLIIGSMVPDFQAFINLGGDKVWSHSWAGVLTYDLPVGLMTAVIFHYIVRNAFVIQLPGFLKKRFVAYIRIRSSQYFHKRIPVIIVSLLIGIITHLLWDRITHTDTYTYTQRAGIDLTGYQSMRLRQLLQWGCSFAGLAIILWQLLILPKFKGKAPKAWLFYWPIVLITGVVLYGIRLQWWHTGDDMINTAVAGLMLGIITASAAYNLKQYRSIWLQ